MTRSEKVYYYLSTKNVLIHLKNDNLITIAVEIINPQ